MIGQEVIDIPNFALTAGEVVQDIRDRDIKFLGISSLAGGLEERFRPQYDSFVRARWARTDNVLIRKSGSWASIKGIKKAGALAKKKEMAVVVGVPNDELEELDSYGFNFMWSAAAYKYRGVHRAGLYPRQYKADEELSLLAMLVGKNDFNASLGYVALGKRVMNIKDVRRSYIKNGTLLLPGGVETIDILPAEELSESYPDTPLV